jgi:hypothetical protein
MGIRVLTGAVVVASIHAACATDLPLNVKLTLPLDIRPPVQRASEPRRLHRPDAGERELLFQQFQDWLRTRGYKYIQLDSDGDVAATDALGKSPAEAGLRMSSLR